MNTRFGAIVLAVTFGLLSGCSAYSEEDYGEAETYSVKEQQKTQCKNMDPAQEIKCKEAEEALVIGLGADKNCNHPYEYERNRCINDSAKRKKQLDDSLKKHEK